MDWFLRLCARAFFLGVTKHHIARRVARWGLVWRMQRFEKCHERRCLRRTQVLSVRRHVSASLDDLADELVLREPRGNAVQSRTSLASRVAEGMAVAALLALKNQRALPLKRRCAAEESVRHRIAAPGIHVRAPRCISGKMRQCSERYRQQQDGENRDGPPAPAFFSFAR